MRGYLSIVSKVSGTPIPVDERVEIFRDPGDTEEIVARKSRDKHRLNVCDATVSRPKDGTPPVVVEPCQSYIEIRNECNSNGVTLNPGDDGTQLPRGRVKQVDDTVSFSIGYHTTFRLTVKEEAQTDITVEGSVGGDVVAGDQTDRGTHVVDSVVNRSDISGDGGQSARVENSVVNRSSVGDTSETESTDDDTKDHCPRHERLYTSDVCPACAEETIGKTKFCMSCGSEIAQSATTCPDCGGEILDSG